METIGLSLIATLISFLFDQEVLRQSNIDIKGAPFWYEKQGDSNKIYISTYIDGDYTQLSNAKQKLIKKTTVTIKDGYDVVIKSEIKKATNEKERVFIKSLNKDYSLEHFVKQNLVFQDIKYDDTIKRVFIRGYVPLENFKKYQNERMVEIKKKILDNQFDNMMDELKKEAS